MYFCSLKTKGGFKSFFIHFPVPCQKMSMHQHSIIIDRGPFHSPVLKLSETPKSNFRGFVKTLIVKYFKMLFQWLKLLADKRIILASGSPRRREILESINLKIEVHPSSFEENLNSKDFPSFADFVIQTARGKAEDVAERFKDAELVIAADTMVVLDANTVMGKPKTSQSATEMLQMLSGRTHKVFTGVVLIWPENGEIVKFCESTSVTFAQLSDQIIAGYVATGEPLDKAGGYGIQGLGGSLIESIEGDFYTVMGLPLHRFCFYINDHYSKKWSR